jgi:hypothetical protein
LADGIIIPDPLPDPVPLAESWLTIRSSKSSSTSATGRLRAPTSSRCRRGRPSPSS